MNRGDDVRVAHADDDHVVRVVRHRGTERAPFQSEAADESHTDIPSRAVTFDDHEFQNVSRDVGNDFPIRQLRLRQNLFRDDLVRHDFDHADFFRGAVSRNSDFEIGRRAIVQVHRAARLFRGRAGGAEISAVLRHERAFLVNAPDFKLRQVIHDDEVRPITRRNRALIFQPVITRGVDRSHLDRGHRRHAKGDRFPDRMIDVAFVHQIARQLVVGREGAIGGVLRRNQRDDVFEVSLRAAFAHEQMHSEP